MLGNNLHNANDGNREQQTPYPLESTSEEQRNKYRHWIHLRDVAGHPADDKDATEGGDPQRARVSQRVAKENRADEYDNCTRGYENIRKMPGDSISRCGEEYWSRL